MIDIVELYVPRYGWTEIEYSRRLGQGMTVRFLDGRDPDRVLEVAKLNRRARDRIDLAIYHDVEAALRRRWDDLETDRLWEEV